MFRNDQVRNATEDVHFDSNDIYDIITNPHPPDKLLLRAFDIMSDQDLHKVAEYGCWVHALLEVDPNELHAHLFKGVFMEHTVDRPEYELAQLLAEAAGNDWFLGEQVVQWMLKE